MTGRSWAEAPSFVDRSPRARSSPAGLARTVAVALGVVVLLAAVEVGVGTFLASRSDDLSRLPAYRTRAAELARCSWSIAILGSSVAEAIDPRLLEAALALSGAPAPCVASFAVDNAGATTLGAMAWHTFWTTGNRPDALLIVAAEYSLNDEADGADIGRLARYFDDHGAWPALESAHLLSPSQWRDYALSRRSATWAFRRRIGRRLGAGTTDPCAGCAAAPGAGERPARLVEGNTFALRSSWRTPPTPAPRWW